MLEHEVELFFCSTGWRTGPEVFVWCLGGAPPFFSNASSLPSFEEVKGIVTILVPYLERKEVSSCRLRGKRSFLVSREVGEACPSVFEMELLSVSLDWGKLSVSSCRRWGKGQLSPPLLGARSLQSSHDQNATYQEVKELSATQGSLLFLRLTCGRETLFLLWSMRWGTYRFILKAGLRMTFLLLKVGVNSSINWKGKRG